MASRLVLSLDGGLWPETRITLALDGEPVDGSQVVPGVEAGTGLFPQ